MPATPLFHPDDASSKHTGRLGRITKRETASLAALKQLVRKQGLNLGLVRGPGEQNDVCLLRFLRAQGFEEKRALASLVSCVEWGARVGLSGLRGHLGGGDESPGSVVPQTAEGLVSFGSGVDRQGRPVVILRLGGLTDKLVEACGRKALIRYFIWGAERVLERVAASMLSSQFIVEGIVIVCDAQGWNQETVGDGVFSFLQEAASLGLSYYPERLGQMLVVNVSPEDSENIILAARALGLGAAIDGGRLRVLSGDLPKWAPETQKAIAPEHLPVDYGGTAPALQLPPSDIPGKDNRVSPSSSTPGSMGKTLWWLLGGGETVFEIRGLHAVVLFLALWALHRESARLGEAALLGLALVLGARECVGGSAVTPPSAMLRVPLLHDLGVVVRAAAAWNSNKGSVCVGPAGDQDGDGTDGQGVARLSGSVVSLVGARVEIVKVVGTGQSGFDRFCIKVQSVQTPGGYGKTSDKWREWVRWRRLIEFVALRNSLLKAGYPRADGAELDPRTWQLPPAVHTDALARRLEAWLQRLLDGGNSADTEKIRIFLHEDESRSPLASRPRHPRPIQQQQQQRRPASTLYPADREAAADTDTQGPSTPSRIPGRPRRQTAPPKIVMSQLPAKAMSNAGASDSGVGRAAPSRTGSDSLWSGSRSVDETVWNGGGDSAAREIPSLRPELRSMFQDPGECHTLIVPEGEQNRWLKRANRAVAHFPSSNVTPSEAFFPTAASGSGERDGVGKSFSLGVNGFGGSNPSSPLRNRDRSASLLMGSPLRSKGNCGGDVGVPPWEAPSLDSKRGDPSPPRGKALGEGKEEQASPGRRREALKRFVSLMKRKGVKRGCPGDAALFRLLHVDVFQVPPDNHLHRVDHIVGLGGGRAQARVKQLTAKKPEGVEFLFVVNLQLPRSFTKSHSAASVVLYWGIPLEELSGSGVTAADPPKASSSKKPSFLSPSPSSIIPGLFERELLMRYIDLPFNRVNRDGPGVNVLKDDGGMGEGSNGALPGLSAVDDDDSESGVLPDKDFRNMSLKVVTSVVQGRWTVQKAVDEGNSQVLSRKLTQRYFRGSLYMETDVEIGSSVAAESVVGVCLTEPCILDVGFFLEGSSRILGCVRTRRVDLSLAEPLLLVASATQTSFALTPTVTAPPSPSDPSMTASTAMKTANGGGIGEGGMPLGNPQFASTWEDNGETHTFRVRGPGYLSGGGKVDAGKPFGRLVRADLFKMEAGVDRVDNVGSVGRAGKVVRRLQKGGEFLIIVNLQVPGNPPLSMVLYYAVPVPPGGEPQPGTDGRSQGFLDLFRRFVDLGPLNNSDEPDGSVLEGEMGLEEAGGGGRLPGDDLRNLRFKLLPSILEGPWIVRKAVGSKPTLIAQKLTCRYFRTRNYFEVDIDIGSSVVAYNTVSLAIGYAKSLVVDMGFCVQGEKEEELPEVLLGVARLKRLDVLLADNLEVNEEHEDSDDEEEKADETGKNPQERKTGARLTELGDGAGGGGTSAGGKGGSNAAPGVSLSVVVPSEGDDSVAAEPSPIASPGLEDVFLDSGSDHIFRVRGSNYIVDGRKISAGQPFGTLLRADLFRIDGARHHLYRVDHICTHGKMKDRVEFLLSGSNPPFLFVVNIQMPGDRAHSVVLCWGMRLKEAEEAAVAGRLSREDSNFLNLFRRYIHLDLEGGLPINDIRNRRLKLFPRVLQGPWVVRKAIGKPCVIGRKLTARYFRRPGYFEVDIDVGSTALASNATHLAGGYAKNLVLDLGFALQGEAEDELPEKMIGSARIVRPDLGRAEALDW